MNIVKSMVFALPAKASVGGSVYVPPTLCLRPAYSAAHASAYVERTESPRTNGFVAILLATGLGQNYFFPGVR